MLSYGQAFYRIRDQLQPLYGEGEATAIAHMLMEHITGLGKLQRLDKKDITFTKVQQAAFDKKTKELAAGRPIQYVTGSTWFMDHEFLVNENVLIPRPETAELVEWVTNDSKGREKLRILDVGTGSGCIGISLAGILNNAFVTCIDKSKEALEVAATNIQWVLTSEQKKENIKLLALDFLAPEIRNTGLPRYDIIVSNPPYIPVKEKEKLHKNVRTYEPAMALFVPNSDPLVFYKAIAAFGKDHLRQGGSIYCELDAAHAGECKAMFIGFGYANTEIRKDMHGNWRMLRCSTAGE